MHQRAFDYHFPSIGLCLLCAHLLSNTTQAQHAAGGNDVDHHSHRLHAQMNAMQIVRTVFQYLADTGSRDGSDNGSSTASASSAVAPIRAVSGSMLAFSSSKDWIQCQRLQLPNQSFVLPTCSASGLGGIFATAAPDVDVCKSCSFALVSLSLNVAMVSFGRLR